MLDELSERNEQTLYELTARLIMRHEVAISRQALAKHIDLLEQAGLVSSEKRGKYRMLAFNDEPPQGCHGSMAQVIPRKEREARYAHYAHQRLRT